MSLCINPQCNNTTNPNTLLFCRSCGAELLVDGRYRVQSLLGHGGFGLTYEVWDLHSRPKVLKVLTDNHPKYVEFFQQEARVLETMNHPGIPKLDLNGYFTYHLNSNSEPLHCIVMEKIEGLNLEEYLSKRGEKPIAHKRALRWLAELSLILEQVHDLNFFHRDIKPSNIMLRPNGGLALIDFGTVREISNTYVEKQSAGKVTGVVSSGYTPVEQMRGKAVKQSDFYALAGTIIYLLTALNPLKFYDSTKDKLDWAQAVPDISPQFANLIDSMLSFLPRDRPQSAREIFQEIVKIDSSLQIVENYWLDLSNTSDSRISATQSQQAKYPEARSPEAENVLTPESIEQCRQELIEFIGPMANIICNRTLASQSNLSHADFISLLAQKIPNERDRQRFKQRLL